VDEGVALDLESRKKLIFPELLGGRSSRVESDDVAEGADSIDAEYGETFDVRKLMRDAKDPLTGTLRDLRIDDRDLEVAKNYYDWCFRVSGRTEYPWARQLWIILKLHNELCPRCNRPDMFGDIMAIDKSMPGEELGDRLTILEYGVCPGCGARKSELVRSKEMNLYDELILTWGQRSGKSTTAVGASAYQLHRYLKFPMFGTLIPTMSTATPLTSAFVSLTFGKAFKVLWQPFRSLIASTPWYRELFKILDFYGNQYGEELYFRRKEFLQFVHKNLAVAPTSPAWDVLRGDTRYEGIIDELGLFRLPDEDEGDEDAEDSSKRANADEAHKSLDNSLLTVRTAAEYLLLEKGMDAVPTGVLMGVSSPTSMRDKVMRLLAESKTDVGGSHMLGSQLPTWEVNPSISRTSRAIVSAYAKNPAKAERDFGANPVAGANAYLHGPYVASMFMKYRSTHKLIPVKGAGGEIWAVAKQLRPVESPTLLVLDAGYTNNSFAIICFSLGANGTVKTETVCELMPEGRRINFNQLYLNAILPIGRDNFSCAISADQWQSLDTLSRYVSDGPYSKTKYKKFSLARKHFDSVRQQINDQAFVLPAPEMDIADILERPDSVNNYRTFFYGKPVSHLAHQFVTIREVGAQACPEKGLGWTDDLARAWFLGAFLMQDQAVRKILLDARPYMPKASSGGASPIGIFVPRR